MKFCKKCGLGYEDDVALCDNCNTELTVDNTLTDEKLKTLSNRIKIWGLIKIILGISQICSVLFFIAGLINLLGGIDVYRARGNVLKFRKNLVEAYTPIGGTILLIFSDIIIVGPLGLTNSLYYLFGVRGYVMGNTEYFNTLK